MSLEGLLNESVENSSFTNEDRIKVVSKLEEVVEVLEADRHLESLLVEVGADVRLF